MIDNDDYDDMSAVCDLVNFLEKFKIVSASEKNFTREYHDFCSGCMRRYERCDCSDNDDYWGTDYDYDHEYDQAKDAELEARANPVFEAIESKENGDKKD